MIIHRHIDSARIRKKVNLETSFDSSSRKILLPRANEQGEEKNLNNKPAKEMEIVLFAREKSAKLECAMDIRTPVYTRIHRCCMHNDYEFHRGIKDTIFLCSMSSHTFFQWFYSEQHFVASS